jgi:hypothetical protein
VRTEWPSPQQFNHAIIAVTAPAGTRLPALGAENAPSLVFFDPTDDVTPFGELPMYLQGSLGLLVTAEGGSLVRMPVTAPDANQAARVVQATVSGDGTLTATVRHTSAGDPATMERQLLASLSKDGYLRRLESDIRRQIPGATLAQSRVAEDAAANRFELTLQIEARGYAQVLQQRLMLIRAPQSVRTGLPTLIAPARATPVLLDPRDERDRFELELPAGASVDEMPPPRRMEAPFGHFSVQWTAEGRTVVRAVELRVSRTAVQPADYPRLRAFLDAFREAERQPIVLTR